MAEKKSPFWKNRRVLVTGGAGFIGSWLVKALTKRGAIVTVFDLKTGSPVLDSLLAKPLFVKADVRDLNAVTKAINAYQPDTLFHLAAQAVVGLANKDPLLTLETNIMGTYNVLEAGRRLGGLSRLIFMSSDKAYGSQKKLPYTENMPLLGQNPYDASKSCADRLCQQYFRVFRLPISIVRSANVFGGGDLHFSRLAPSVIRACLKNQNPLIRSDGKFLRDYVYVDDVVNGFIALAEAMPKRGIVGEAVNLGTARPRSVLEVTNTILRLMGKGNLKPIILNKAVGEIRNQYLSGAKAKKLLGWKPATLFEDGIKETINWYRDNIGNIPARNKTDE